MSDSPPAAPLLADIPAWILQLEAARLERLALKVRTRVAAVTNAGPRYAQFQEAAAAYCAAHPREFSRTLGPCPICPSPDGFKAHGRIPGKWGCWSSQHTIGGTKRQGHWLGNVLDLDAMQHGRTPKQHLEITGYWGAGVAAERFAAKRDERLSVLEPAPAEVDTFPPPRSADLTRSFAGLCSIVRHPELARPVLRGRAIEYNEMSGKAEIGRVSLDDTIVSEIRERIELAHSDRGGVGLTFSDMDIWKAISRVAHERPYHPVREYLHGRAGWDGVARWENVPEDHFGCAGTPIERAIMKRWAISCIARAMKPGCKVDTALVLFGKQSLGKSTWFKTMASAPWFSDTAMRLGDKDAYEQMRGVWIYEWQELSALHNARSLQDVKGFISSAEENYRRPYGHGTERIPRSTILVGSTDREDFLNDPAGERRFLPITVHHVIDSALVAEARDQLWAEAVALYDAGEQWWLTDEESELLEPAHKQHRQIDEWEEPISEWLVSPGAMDGITVTRVLLEALGKKIADQSVGEQRRAARVLRELHYKMRQETTGRRRRLWVREAEPVRLLSAVE